MGNDDEIFGWFLLKILDLVTLDGSVGAVVLLAIAVAIMLFFVLGVAHDSSCSMDWEWIGKKMWNGSRLR
jgi:hypothetical protein